MNRGTSAARGFRKRSRLLSIAALVLGASLLAACAGPTDGGDDDAGDDKVVLGIIGFSAADATLNKTAEAVVALAEENGWETDYQAANPAGDAASANSIMQVMLEKGATMIMTLAFDTDTLGAGIAAAQAKDVPVLAMSSGKLSPGVAWASDVGYVPDMGEQIEADFADAEKVEVLNLTYLLATPGQGRNKLIQEVAENNPKFTLTDKDVPIPGAVQGGRDFTAAWLAANPPDRRCRARDLRGLRPAGRGRGRRAQAGRTRRRQDLQLRRHPRRPVAGQGGLHRRQRPERSCAAGRAGDRGRGTSRVRRADGRRSRAGAGRVLHRDHRERRAVRDRLPGRVHRRGRLIHQ